MPFPWLKNYDSGVDHQIGNLEYKNLVDFFETNCRKHDDYPAIENMGVSLTYRQVDSYSNHFGAYLQGIGLRPGDRIAIQLPNVLQFPVVLMGAFKAGLTVVPTNPLYTPREMKHQLRDSGAIAIVILSNFAANLEKIIQDTTIRHVIVTRMGDLLGTLKGSIVNFVVKKVKKMEPPFQIDGAITFKDAIKQGKRLQLSHHSGRLDDLAILQYTGGTTGVAKGAMLSHRNILSHTGLTANWLKAGFIGNHQDVFITALPLYHIYSFCINLMLGYQFGGKNVLITNPRDIDGFVKELSKHKFSMIQGVNTLYNALLNHPGFAKLDFSKLRLAGTGAMALQEPTANRWREITSIEIIQGYGLSENSGALTINPLQRNKLGTIGVPISNTELGIFDETGNQLPQGEIGEICARGPQIMRGYWNSDNINVFHEGGWFKTGDIGLMDADGYFKLMDRQKDMIIVSGFNVYPNEIENVVALHPKVFECGVIGVPDEQCGEAVKLFVVRKDKSLTEEELRGYCKDNFTRYKIPKYFSFTDALPKTSVGKILRRELRVTIDSSVAR